MGNCWACQCSLASAPVHMMKSPGGSRKRIATRCTGVWNKNEHHYYVAKCKAGAQHPQTNEHIQVIQHTTFYTFADTALSQDKLNKLQGSAQYDMMVLQWGNRYKARCRRGTDRLQQTWSIHAHHTCRYTTILVAIQYSRILQYCLDRSFAAIVTTQQMRAPMFPPCL